MTEKKDYELLVDVLNNQIDRFNPGEKYAGMNDYTQQGWHSTKYQVEMKDTEYLNTDNPIIRVLIKSDEISFVFDSITGRLLGISNYKE